MSSCTRAGKARRLGGVALGLRALALTALVSAASACSGNKSYIVVTVFSANDMDFTGVAQFEVLVRNCPLSDRLYYPANPQGDAAATMLPGTISFSRTKAVTFSVSFASVLDGPVDIGVTALAPDRTRLGYGTTLMTARIDKGHTVQTSVRLEMGKTAPYAQFTTDSCFPDAGTPVTDGSTGTPVAVMCEPLAGTGCAAGSSCAYTGCRTSTPIGMCVAAGTGKLGEVCSGDSDCEAGSPCLMERCQVRTCQRLCRADADCAGTPGSRCLTDTQVCGAMSAVGICSRPCDPRGAASTGCLANQRCFIFQTNEIPSCDCVDSTRAAGDGMGCATSNDCVPGLMCVATKGGQTVCRPVCRLDSPGDCASDRTCARLTMPAFTTYGACAPK